MQLKYSNYVAFSHFHGKAVNNSGEFTKSLITLFFIHFSPTFLSIILKKVRIIHPKHK